MITRNQLIRLAESGYGNTQVKWVNLCDVNPKDLEDRECVEALADIWNACLVRRVQMPGLNCLKDTVDLALKSGDIYPIHINDNLLYDALRQEEIEPALLFVRGSLQNLDPGNLRDAVEGLLADLQQRE